MRKIAKQVFALLLALLMLPVVYFTPAKADGNITVFKQTDEQWKDNRYYYDGGNGSNSFSASACGIFALVNAVYYLNGTYINPVTLANYAAENNYHGSDGTKHGLYSSFAKWRGANYGFEYVKQVSSFSALRDYLKQGSWYAAICFNRHHVMSIVDYRASDGKYLLLDSAPNSNRGTSGGYTWKTEYELTHWTNAWRDDPIWSWEFHIIKSTIGNYDTFDGKYQIMTALKWNMNLDVSGNSYDNLEHIQIWPGHTGPAQVFTITNMGNGWHTIRPADSNTALDVYGGVNSAYDGAAVVQWECHGGDNQLWRFVRSEGGYRIQSKLGYYLDVQGGSTENGTPVQLWSNNGTNAQLWFIDPFRVI